MNEILFYLYLADFSQSLSGILGVIGVFLAAIIVLTFAFRAAAIHDSVPKTEEEAQYKKNYKKLRWLWIPAAFMMVSVLLPSKQFLYIAAGGTAAVKALDSELGKKVQTLVNQKLDEVIQPTKKETK